MKHIPALILAAAAALTLAACSSSDSSGSSDNNTGSSTTTTTAADNTSSTSDATDSKPAEAENSSSYDSAAAVLEAVWEKYPEADKFPVFGGSTDVAPQYDGKPGPFTLTMTAEMTSSLKVPENIMPQIKSAASMIHMMNANTFTSAAFEADGDIDAFSKALVDGVNSTQWVCGFPQTVITVKVGNYLIMAFGNGEVMNKFKTAVMAVDGAALVHEGPVSFGDGNNDNNNDGNGGVMIPVF